MWKKVPCVAICPACDSKLHESRDFIYYHMPGDLNANILSCSESCPVNYSHMTLSQAYHEYDGCILDRNIYCKIDDDTYKIDINYILNKTSIYKCKKPEEKYCKNKIYEYPFFEVAFKDYESIVQKVKTLLVFF